MWCKSTKFVYEFCGLDPLGTLAPVDIATLSCFNHDFLRIFTQTPCLFNGTYSSRKSFMNFCKKYFNNDIYIRLVTITTNYHDGNLGYNLLLSRAFSVGIPLTVGFRPQLIVISGLSVGIPLTVGFRPQLVVVLGLSVGIPLTVGFRLSRSLWLSQSPSRTLPLLRWNSGYHEAFHTNFFLSFTMEF
jgi:hypothetical protein